MSEKKNIDRLFQEKFKDFEAVPNDAVWNRISESLPNKKKKRRVIALWWQVGGVAALIALLLTVGVSVFNSNDNNNQNSTIVNTEDKNVKPKDESTLETEDKSDLINGTDEEKLKLVNSGNDEASIEKEDNISLKTSSNKLSTTVKPTSKSYSVASKSNKDDKKRQSSKKANDLKLIIPKTENTKIAENSKTTSSSSSSTLKNDVKTLLPKSQIDTSIEKAIEDTQTAVAENISSNNKSESESSTSNVKDDKTDDINGEILLEDSKKQSIENAIAESTKTIDEKEEDEQNRWSIAPNVAPVYYSSLGQGSSLDQQFNNNDKNSAINMSYGITGAYSVSKKLKIRAGISRVNLSQTTSDVFAFAGSDTASRGGDSGLPAQSAKNISFNDGGSNVVLMSSTMLSGSSAPELFNAQVAGEVEQRFGFIEVPLELEYSLIDKKFGLNVIGGFSTFFLNENEIYADIDGSSTLIGEANNINNTSFSANFGLGLDYKLTKQWNINLEPQFKYQINTFNNTSGNFRPFFIGVYTGLSFKF